MLSASQLVEARDELDIFNVLFFDEVPDLLRISCRIICEDAEDVVFHAVFFQKPADVPHGRPSTVAVRVHTVFVVEGGRTIP